MIRAFFFDLDGTLLDTEILWVQAARAFLQAHGVAYTQTEATELIYGHSWRDVYAEMTRRFPQLAIGMDRAGAEMRVFLQRLRAETDVRITGSDRLRLAAHGYCGQCDAHGREAVREVFPGRRGLCAGQAGPGLFSDGRAADAGSAVRLSGV